MFSSSADTSSFHSLSEQYIALGKSLRAQGERVYDLADRCDKAAEMAGWMDEHSKYLDNPSTASCWGGVTHIAAGQLETLGKLQRQAEDELGETVRLIEFSVGAATSSMSTVYSGTVADVLQHGGEVRIINFDHGKEQGDLDRLLQGVTNDQTLVDRRREAWRTYTLGTRESRIQACHTLREILTGLLDELAPADEVRNAVRWQPPDHGKPSKRDKIRFFMIGREPWDEEPELSLINEQVEMTMEKHDAAIGIAHAKEEISHDACRQLMHALEGAILNLLNARESVAYQLSLRRYG